MIVPLPSITLGNHSTQSKVLIRKLLKHSRFGVCISQAVATNLCAEHSAGNFICKTENLSCTFSYARSAMLRPEGTEGANIPWNLKYMK